MLWDTGPLYAAFDRDDKHHAASAALMRATAPPLLVPSPVVVEVCYHLQKHLGAQAEIAFLRSVQRGQLRLMAPETADFDRALELVEQYQGFPLRRCRRPRHGHGRAPGHHPGRQHRPPALPRGQAATLRCA